MPRRKFRPGPFDVARNHLRGEEGTIDVWRTVTSLHNSLQLINNPTTGGGLKRLFDYYIHITAEEQ
jgi:hypothetical protein